MDQTSLQPIVRDSYDPGRFIRLFSIEDRHFWFLARNRVISNLVSQIVTNLASGYRVLEVGCGTGNVLRILEQACPFGMVIGMDLFAEGLQYARWRTTCPLVQGDIRTQPFGTQFDLIGLFDVLEHLTDDIQILRDLHAMLASAGTLLLTVPAHMSLWGYHDEAAHHCRRYDLAELENKLTRAGYRVEYMTQYMAGIFPLVWVERKLTTLFDRCPAGFSNRTRHMFTRDLRITPVVNDLLYWLLAQEIHVISRRHRLPIGVSLLAIARKESGLAR